MSTVPKCVDCQFRVGRECKHELNVPIVGLEQLGSPPIDACRASDARCGMTGRWYEPDLEDPGVRN